MYFRLVGINSVYTTRYDFFVRFEGDDDVIVFVDNWKQ